MGHRHLGQPSAKKISRFSPGTPINRLAMPVGRPRTVIDPALLSSGLSAAEIARRVGCNPTTVLNRQRELGVATRPPGRPKRRQPVLPDPLNTWLNG
jgi:hypothetical protein